MKRSPMRVFLTKLQNVSVMRAIKITCDILDLHYCLSSFYLRWGAYIDLANILIAKENWAPRSQKLFLGSEVMCNKPSDQEMSRWTTVLRCSVSWLMTPFYSRLHTCETPPLLRLTMRIYHSRCQSKVR